MSITDGERAMVRRLMTSRSDADVGPLVELGTRCLDVAVEVLRSYDIVGEPDPSWDRDSYETMGWVITAAARRSPDEFFSWVRSSHVADVVTFQVAYLDDPRASDYLLDVVRGDEPGAKPFYRGQAIRALAAWRRTAAAEPAVAMLSSTDSLEVFAAAEALEVLADERALPRLHYLAADDHTSKGTLLSVSRTIGRLERGEQFPTCGGSGCLCQMEDPPSISSARVTRRTLRTSSRPSLEVPARWSIHPTFAPVTLLPTHPPTSPGVVQSAIPSTEGSTGLGDTSRVDLSLRSRCMASARPVPVTYSVEELDAKLLDGHEDALAPRRIDGSARGRHRPDRPWPRAGRVDDEP